MRQRATWKSVSFWSAAFALAALGCVWATPAAVRAADAGYAGTFYEEPGNPGYWKYVDAAFGAELLVPSTASSYTEEEAFGETILRVGLAGGPTIHFGRLPAPGGGAEALRGRLLSRWQLLLDDRTVTNDEVIETSAGERPHFTAVRGRRADGRDGMIRLVVFSREGEVAYLLLLSDAAAYDAVTSQYWIRAVNSFRWRS